MENLSNRKAQITDMNHVGNQVSVEALVPMRGLIGFETDLVNSTKGMGVMSHLFHEYGPDRGEIAARKNGSLVSMDNGEATAYALNMVQERGRLMVEPGDKIYIGMIVGENARENDIPVNPVKEKRLTNMRSQGDGKGIPLAPPFKMSPRTRAGIHRRGRIRGSHAEEPAPPQKGTRRKQAQTLREIPRDQIRAGVKSFTPSNLFARKGIFCLQHQDFVAGLPANSMPTRQTSSSNSLVDGEGADGFQQLVEHLRRRVLREGFSHPPSAVVANTIPRSRPAPRKGRR